jgi:hypothetical protein
MIPVSTMGPIQTAIYQKLTGDATLTGLVEGVHDQVPEGQDLPYVQIGEAYATPRNSHSEFGRRTIISLHVWSDHKGFSEANQITSRLTELLDHQPLTVDGQHVVSVRQDFEQTLNDPAGVRHVVIRFAVTTEQDDSESS